MKPFSPLCCVALACLPAFAIAQSASDPSVVVPTVPYRSVFTDTPKGVEADTLDWKAANTQVGQFLRGHIDILKWEAAQRAATAPTAPTVKDTSKP